VSSRHPLIGGGYALADVLLRPEQSPRRCHPLRMRTMPFYLL
jgi:hypothetical protein